MRKLISLTIMGVLTMGLGVGLSGCSEESKTESKTVQQTPGGNKTTETETKSIKQSGDNPPPPTKTP